MGNRSNSVLHSRKWHSMETFEINAILLDPSYLVNKSLKNVDTEPIGRMFTHNVFYLFLFLLVIQYPLVVTTLFNFVMVMLRH